MAWYRPISPGDRGFLMVGILRLADVVAVAVCALFALWLRADLDDVPAHYTLAVILGMVGVANTVQLAGLYEFQSLARIRGQFGRVSLVWLGVILALIALAYFTKTSDNYSRIWAATWFVTVNAMLIINRVVAVSRIEKMRAEGKLARRIAIIGQGTKAQRLRAIVNANDPRDMKVAGMFEAPAGDDENMTDLLNRISANEIDEVVVAIDSNDRDVLQRIIKALGSVSVEARLAPDAIDLPFPILGTSYVGTAPLFDIHHRPQSVWSRVVKRLEDLILGALAVVVLSPLMALIALAVAVTSRGPVLFRQERLGFNNNTFTMLKFRTMYDRPADDGKVVQARRDDPRVTPVGRFLRRTSLDELPQLFNVLRGEMSLVGPRPHAVAHDQEYAGIIDGYLRRHRVKPGITGLAQVNGFRGETDTPEKMRARVEHDLYYIEHWSLWLDIKILVRTFAFGFIHRNAY